MFAFRHDVDAVPPIFGDIVNELLLAFVFSNIANHAQTPTAIDPHTCGKRNRRVVVDRRQFSKKGQRELNL